MTDEELAAIESCLAAGPTGHRCMRLKDHEGAHSWWPLGTAQPVEIGWGHDWDSGAYRYWVEWTE